MNNAFVLGPLVLPYSLLLVFAAMAVTLYIGKRIGQRVGIYVESALWKTPLFGLVVARLAFVLEFRSAYLASPLGILDIRDVTSRRNPATRSRHIPASRRSAEERLEALF